MSVEITLGQTETRNVSVPGDGTVTRNLIKPGDIFEWTKPEDFDGGCAKMFIWATDENVLKGMLWCGVIPLGLSEPIKITTDEKGTKVVVSDGEVPMCPELLPRKKGTVKEMFTEEKGTQLSLWWWVIFILVLLLCFLLYSQTRKRK